MVAVVVGVAVGVAVAVVVGVVVAVVVVVVVVVAVVVVVVVVVGVVVAVVVAVAVVVVVAVAVGRFDMSRIPEGECDGEEEQRLYALQQANTARQIRGKKGQAFLRELLAALEALPEKRLIEEAIAKDGCVCALGSLALKRRVDAGEDRAAVIADLETVIVDDDHEDWDGTCIWDWAEGVLGCPSRLAWHIPNLNDDGGLRSVYEGTGDDHRYVGQVEITPEERYARMVRNVKRMLGMEVGT